MCPAPGTNPVAVPVAVEGCRARLLRAPASSCCRLALLERGPGRLCGSSGALPAERVSGHVAYLLRAHWLVLVSRHHRICWPLRGGVLPGPVCRRQILL